MPGRPLAPLLVLTLAVVSPARSQNVVLDEGTFRVLYHGEPVGAETFTIRRLGQGSEAHLIANAVIEVGLPNGPEQIKPLLRTGADLSLSAYQVEVSGLHPTEIAVTSTGRRLVARTRSPTGEQEREFRAAASGVLIDEGVAHQYWFLARLGQGAEVTVLIPRAGRQSQIQVRSVQPATLRVAGEAVEARHVTFDVDGRMHEVWYDTGDRVLRVEISDTGFVAERTSQ